MRLTHSRVEARCDQESRDCYYHTSRQLPHPRSLPFLGRPPRKFRRKLSSLDCAAARLWPGCIPTSKPTGTSKPQHRGHPGSCRSDCLSNPLQRSHPALRESISCTRSPGRSREELPQRTSCLELLDQRCCRPESAHKPLRSEMIRVHCDTHAAPTRSV